VDTVLNKQVFQEFLSCQSCGNPYVKTEGTDYSRGVPYSSANTKISWPNPPASASVSPSSQDKFTRSVQAFMIAIMTQGLRDISEALGPSWANYAKTRDFARGINQFIWQEMYVDGATHKNSHHRYGISIDWPNCPAPGTTYHNMYVAAGFPGCDPVSYYAKYSVNITNSDHWTTAYDLNSDLPDLKARWEKYVLGLWAAQSYGFIDHGSFLWWSVIDRLENRASERVVLKSVPVTVTRAGGAYVLTWTPPPGVTGYELHYRNDGRKIVDSLGFSAATNTYTLNPAAFAPWWSSIHSNVSISPTAASATLNLLGTTTYTFGLKAYVKAQ
jgi:hypothetical protein